MIDKSYLCPSQLLPDEMLGAGLFGCPTEFARGSEHVLYQWAATDFVIAYLGILAMFRTKYPKTFAVGTVVGVVEVTEHVIT